MSTACQHCQFLVARDPHTGTLPEDCPRCRKSLVMARDVAAAPAPSLATLLNAAPVVAEAETKEPQTDEPPIAGEPRVDETEASADETLEERRPDPADDDNGIASGNEAAHADGAAVPAVDTPRAQIAAAAASVILTRKATGPRFLHQPRTTPVHARRARRLWAAVAALGALLCVQVVLADRARLATQAGWRPVVVALCGAFRCDVPIWREPAAFTMLSRDVRPLTGMPGTLQAQATFRNDARWPQSWPVILLTLKDADGRTLGARALRPADYLPADEALTIIEPGQSAQMAVRIREPSASVVAFSFDFR